MKAIIYPVILLMMFFTVSMFAQNMSNNQKASKEIEKIDKKFADSFSTGNASGMISCYTEDAMFLPPNSKAATGKDSIKKVFLSFLSQGKVNFSTMTNNLLIRKDLAVEQGNYNLSVITKGKKPYKDEGKYIIVWKKIDNSSWKIFYDMYNSDLE